jgi:hypothetical protein
MEDRSSCSDGMIAGDRPGRREKMMLASRSRRGTGLLVFLTLAFTVFAPAQDAAPPAIDPAEIVRRSVEANRKDWNQLPHYDYYVRDREGKGSKTYLSRMILGSRYNQLVAINDQPLPTEAAAREKQKFENELRAREKENPERRRERIEKFQKDRERNELFMNQLDQAFEFALLKTDEIDGRRVYVLAAKPRRGYQPPNMQTKALTGMEGTMWIDAETFHWVKVRAQVVRPVSIEGFLARVERGTHFELDQVRIAEGVWLPSHFVMASRAKVFLIFSRSDRDDQDYFGYRRNNENE